MSSTVDMIQEKLDFLKDIDPLVGILILVGGMGLLWGMDLEKSPKFLWISLIIALLFVHFGVRG